MYVLCEKAKLCGDGAGEESVNAGRGGVMGGVGIGAAGLIAGGGTLPFY